MEFRVANAVWWDQHGAWGPVGRGGRCVLTAPPPPCPFVPLVAPISAPLGCFLRTADVSLSAQGWAVVNMLYLYYSKYLTLAYSQFD